MIAWQSNFRLIKTLSESLLFDKCNEKMKKKIYKKKKLCKIVMCFKTTKYISIYEFTLNEKQKNKIYLIDILKKI